jgi:uncharacterized protein (DUF4415 family)
MKEKRTGRASTEAGSDWGRLRSLTDGQVRRAIRADREVKGTDASFWKGARLVMPKTKETITIRLDADLLKWLRRNERYQTRINAILRSYMNANLGAGR